MRYVLCVALALAIGSVATPADAGLHAIHAIIDKCKAKHDSCFEKLRHHCAMKPKHKHGHGGDCEECGGGCPTCQ
jgi:hypothetical protein